MALSVFDDKERQPRDADVAEALEATYTLWEDLKSQIASQFDPLSVDWGFAGKNYGWSLRLKQKKRTVLYMTPCRGHFLVGFALGEKAVDAAHQRPRSRWPTDLRSQRMVVDAGTREERGCQTDLPTLLG